MFTIHVSLLMPITHCVYTYSFMHGSFSRKIVIFVNVRFISLCKNRLIQTKKKQSDCKMANKRGAYPYRRKY